MLYPRPFMEIGVALPTMARDYTRRTTITWAQGIDAGPFSSVSCGERISFHNQEMLVTNAAAAALTERVRVFVNVAVGPLHSAAILAKQLATLDVLCDGRLTVGLGVGGREHDYRSAGSPYERLHQRLDDLVAELRRLWAGHPPFDGADPIGPTPVQHGGPELLAAAMGPKSLARAARWADGVTGFSVAGVADEMAATFRLAERAWADAGRDHAPRKVNGCFYLLGEDDEAARDELRRFAARYLGVFGREFAEAMAAETRVWNAAELHRLLDDAEAAGCDELILVPGTVDTDCLDRTAAALASRS